MSTKVDVITDWRASHRDELDHSLDVLKSVRDSEDSKDKDRIDAAVAIARLLGAVSDARSTKPETLGKPSPRKDQKDEIEDYISKL